MGDLQREIDKFLKLAYNILIKTASKGSKVPRPGKYV